MDTQHPGRRTNPGGDRITIGPGDTIDRAEFAEFLRTTREQRRITLDQISDETKIAPRHLAALERGDVRTWPQGMYRRAMMRAYAESIGLDKDFALDQFERAFDEAPPAQETLVRPLEPVQPAATIRVPRSTSTGAPAAATMPRAETPSAARRVSTRAIISVGILAAACIVLGVLLWPRAEAPVSTESDAVAEAAPSVQSSTPVSATPVAATTGTEEAMAPPEPIAPVEGQIVVTSEPSGARVTVNGVGWGQTPITIRYLPLGEKRVRLTMQGYVSEERVVTIGRERPNARVQISLRVREQALADRH